MIKKNIEIISLIYKSEAYLKHICQQLKSEYCKVDGWDVGVRVVANDATEKVLDALETSDIRFDVYNDPKPNDFYLNRVYRCWNYAGSSSEYDNICFVNSDMMFSPGWLTNLLKYHDGDNIPCSRLVESGKLRSGTYGIEMDFGKRPGELDQEGFNTFAENTAKDLNCTRPGGLYMPCVFETDRFKNSPMYPEGNVFFNGSELVVGYPNDRPVVMSGDAYYFKYLEHMYGMKHITVFDSIVYHIQEGEKDA